MAECLFCDLSKDYWIKETDHFKVVFDIDPIQEGHMLIIAKEHRLSLLELTAAEGQDLLDLQKHLIAQVEKQGWGASLALNNGELMDEGTHFHCHIIPRFKEDGFWEGVAPLQRKFPKTDLLKEIEG